MTRFLGALPERERWICQHLSIGERRDPAQSSMLHDWIAASSQARETVEASELAPILGHESSRQAGERVPLSWAGFHHSTAERIQSYLAELDRLAARLGQEGISLVALKNGGIARGIYPCPGCCPMGDLDVLVEKRHFRQAHEILLAEGYHFEFRSPLEEAELAAAEESGGAEYWKLLPNGEKLWFELQWRPVAGRWIRPTRNRRPRS